MGFFDFLFKRPQSGQMQNPGMGLLGTLNSLRQAHPYNGMPYQPVDPTASGSLKFVTGNAGPGGVPFSNLMPMPQSTSMPQTQSFGGMQTSPQKPALRQPTLIKRRNLFF